MHPQPSHPTTTQIQDLAIARLGRTGPVNWISLVEGALQALAKDRSIPASVSLEHFVWEVSRTPWHGVETRDTPDPPALDRLRIQSDIKQAHAIAAMAAQKGNAELAAWLVASQACLRRLGSSGIGVSWRDEAGRWCHGRVRAA